MKPSYLIDTDWAIDYLNGYQPTVEKLNYLLPEGLAISIISLAELYEGIYYSSDPERNEKVLNDFLSEITLLELENNICKVFAKERGRLRKKKEIIGDFDLLIASTCLYHDLKLLTNNIKHFSALDKIKIISLS